MASLGVRAWFGLAWLAFVMALTLFVPAGTIRYWQAWVYLSIFFGAAALITLDLLRTDPALLERRLKAGPTAETRPIQRFIMVMASLGFIALLVVPALDRRFGWSHVPLALIVIGGLLVAVGFWFISLVYRENSFTSATIEVAADQRVISTGPYAIVRHPMYASALLYLAGTPLALGSYWGFVPLAAMLPVLIWRLIDEEQMLSRSLPGYEAYRTRVRYRLVPGLW